MKFITGLREGSKTKGHGKNYDISDLLDKVDVILTNHGFVSGKFRDESDTQFYRVYEGFNGYAIVKAVKDNSLLIPYKFADGRSVKCPIYIERINLPDSLNKSLTHDFDKI
jgi:hypothetical protein